MNMIPDHIFPGLELSLHAFGTAHVRKVYAHDETREMCCEVKSESGELMHLSMDYVVEVYKRPTRMRNAG